MDDLLLFLFKTGLVSIVLAFSGFLWLMVVQLWKGKF